VEATDVVAVVMATVLGNQKIPLPNHVSEKVATIQHASQRLLVNLALVMTAVRVARVAVNHEKMRLPPKNQKMILNFDVTFAKVAAVVLTIAPVNKRMLLVDQRMSLASRRMQLVNLAMVLTAVRVARVAVSHEKIRLPLKHQKMTLNFDATFAKVTDVAAVVMTALVKKRMLLVHQRMMSLASRRM